LECSHCYNIYWFYLCRRFRFQQENLDLVDQWSNRQPTCVAIATNIHGLDWPNKKRYRHQQDRSHRNDLSWQIIRYYIYRQFIAIVILPLYSIPISILYILVVNIHYYITYLMSSNIYKKNSSTLYPILSYYIYYILIIVKLLPIILYL